MKACITQPPPPPPPLPVNRQASHFSTYTLLCAASLLAHYKRHQFFLPYNQNQPPPLILLLHNFQGNFIYALCVGRVVTVKSFPAVAAVISLLYDFYMYLHYKLHTYNTLLQSKQTDKMQTAIIITVGGISNVAVKNIYIF